MSSHFISGNNNVFKGRTIFGNVYSDSTRTTQLQGVCVQGNGNYIIDGREYKSDEVTIRTEYKIKSTGEVVYTEPEHVQVQLHGTNMTVDVSSTSGNLEIDCKDSCTFRSVQSTSGGIQLSGNAEKVSTTSGSVEIECKEACTFLNVQSTSGSIKLSGNAEKVSTTSGDVSVDGSVTGPVSTVSGNIRSKNR